MGFNLTQVSSTVNSSNLILHQIFLLYHIYLVISHDIARSGVHSYVLNSKNVLREEIFINHMILLSKGTFTIFKYIIHSKRYMEDIWIQKYAMALIFPNMFKITKLKHLQ